MSLQEPPLPCQTGALPSDTSPRLSAWLENNGVQNPYKLMIRSFPGTGRGLGAELPFCRGETILTVPERLIMSTRSAMNSDIRDKILQPLFVKSSTLTAVEVLCLHLLRERVMGKASHFADYVYSLPTTYPTPCFSWNEELDNLLPDGRRRKLLGQKKDMSRLYRKLKRLVFDHPEKACLFPSVAERDVAWAMSTIQTRGCFWPCPLHQWDENDNTCLVPFGDMFNFCNTEEDDGTSANGGVEDLDKGNFSLETVNGTGFDVRKRVYRFVATDESPGQGAQVFMCYRRASSWELFFQYGFCFPGNPYECIQLQPRAFEKVLHGRFSKDILTLLKSQGLLEHCYLQTDDGAAEPSHNLLTVARLLQIWDALRENSGLFQQILWGESLSNLKRPREEGFAWSFIADLAVELLNELRKERSFDNSSSPRPVLPAILKKDDKDGSFECGKELSSVPEENETMSDADAVKLFYKTLLRNEVALLQEVIRTSATRSDALLKTE